MSDDNRVIELKFSKKMYNFDKSTILTKKQKKLLKDVIKQHTKDIKKHFNEDGWDLNFNLIKSDILNEVFNVDFFGVFATEILSTLKDKYLTSSYGEFVIRDPNYKPLYYDIKKDKIIEVHRSNSNVFINNKNFVSIGTL